MRSFTSCVYRDIGPMKGGLNMWCTWIEVRGKNIRYYKPPFIGPMSL